MVARAPATDDAPAPGTAWINIEEARKGSRGIRELAWLAREFEDRSAIAISDGCHLN
jgi:hypothetical protein